MAEIIGRNGPWKKQEEKKVNFLEKYMDGVNKRKAIADKKAAQNKRWAEIGGMYLIGSVSNPLFQMDALTEFSKEMRKVTGNDKSEVDQKFETWKGIQEPTNDFKDYVETNWNVLEILKKNNQLNPNSLEYKMLTKYESLPKKYKKAIPIIGTAIDISDGALKASEVVYATGEEKYTKLGELAFSTAGGMIGETAGTLAAAALRSPALAPVLSYEIGKRTEAFGNELGFWLGKGTWFVKSNLGGWTKSANNFVDKMTDEYILPSVDMQSGWIQKGSDLSNYLHRGAINWSADKAKQLVNGVGSSIQNGAGSVGNQLSKMLPSPVSREMVQHMTNSFQRSVMAKSVAANNKIDETRLLANQLNDSVNTNFKNSVRWITPYVKDHLSYQRDGLKGQVIIGSNLLQGTLDLPEKFLTPETIEEGFKSAIPLGPISMQNWLDKKLMNHYKQYFIDNPPFKLPNLKTSSSKSYSTSKKHTTTARNAVKNNPQYNNSTNVNMPTGGIQVTVGEPVNFQELAFQVGTRFVTEYKRAMENNKTARA